jgi:serine/threonine protein kinase
MDDLRTRLAGHYTIERELGRGDMATVYLARDVKHGRRVAIKILDPELAQAIGSERFLLEIQISARLTHPNILLLHDSGDYLAGRARSTHVEAWSLAIWYAAAGENVQALDWLDRAYDEHDPTMAYLGVHPSFDRYRARAR